MEDSIKLVSDSYSQATIVNYINWLFVNTKLTEFSCVGGNDKCQYCDLWHNQSYVYYLAHWRNMLDNIRVEFDYTQ
jgi:hypothetical protein